MVTGRISYLTIVVGAILLAIVPLLNPGTYVLHVFVLSFIFGLLAVSWDVLAGYAGQLSFGHAGFFGLGAYTAVLLVQATEMPAWIALLFGGLMSMVFGLVVAVPCLRLRGPYLALTTLAFAEVVRAIAMNWVGVTGGPLGLSGYETLEWISVTRMAYFYVGLAMLFLSLMGLSAIINSPLGLRFMAIRDDDVLAEAIGLDTTRYKIYAFMISAFVAGIAGAFYAFYILVISPLVLEMPITVLAISMAIIGGKGTLIGPVIGGFIVEFISEYFREFQGYRLVLVGIVTMAIVLFIPGGFWQVAQRVRKALETVLPLKAEDRRGQASSRANGERR